MRTVRAIQNIGRITPFAIIVSIIVFLIGQVAQTLLGDYIMQALGKFGITTDGIIGWAIASPLQAAITTFFVILILSLIYNFFRDKLQEEIGSMAAYPLDSQHDGIKARGNVSDSPIVKADRGGNAAGRDIHITQNLVPEKLRPSTKPILRIRDYGNEPKDLYGINDVVVGYNTLYVDVFNKQKSGIAERVWSTIEWINENSVVEVTHRGRWHIASATMKNETIKENLQYRNIDSNQAPQRLYFAWTPKDNHENCFYGLERDMDGRDSWGSQKYKLEAEEYTAKITLLGNNGVKQQFRYRIRNNDGKVSIVDALTNESKQRS